MWIWQHCLSNLMDPANCQPADNAEFGELLGFIVLAVAAIFAFFLGLLLIGERWG